jgi:hypothetical protein
MTSCATCTALIRLCSGLDFFPSDAEVRALLIDRLHRLSGNHDRARRMIDSWLNSNRVAPKIVDLVELAAHLPQSETTTLPAPCDACAPFGGTHRLVAQEGFLDSLGRCVCARGQALRAMDAANRNKPARGREAT